MSAASGKSTCHPRATKDQALSLFPPIASPSCFTATQVVDVDLGALSGSGPCAPACIDLYPVRAQALLVPQSLFTYSESPESAGGGANSLLRPRNTTINLPGRQRPSPPWRRQAP